MNSLKSSICGFIICLIRYSWREFFLIVTFLWRKKIVYLSICIAEEV
jgi:hypothetical protein